MRSSHHSHRLLPFCSVNPSIVCTFLRPRIEKHLLLAQPSTWGMAMENSKTINDLPLALIENILLRLPIKSLLLLRCVCKTWLYLISNPRFAKLHFELAAAPTRRCLFIEDPPFNAISFDLDALFHDGYAPVKFPLPCETPSTVYILGSCRGFILLDDYPHLIIWNPLTGARKQILYSHIMSDFEGLKIDNVHLYGFGYDPSKDDYVVVLAWWDKRKQAHFEFFSMRNNSWKNFEVAFPFPLQGSLWRSGLFLNGAFHWFPCPSHCKDSILVFDLEERSFSKIPLPEWLVSPHTSNLIELGGCLALYGCTGLELCIWVMEEYKVQSSWKLYTKFDWDFNPIGLSNGGDFIGVHRKRIGYTFSKYDVRRQRLEHCSRQHSIYAEYTKYTESLMSLPNDY